ncbi:MAG: Trm112 family protein [Bacteroidetes bacterium]|nr:Trm112 family protein [Bacteroidota bacterium]
MVDARLLDILICPKCKSEKLELKPADQVIVCTDCGQVYRIIQEIPVMIPDDPQPEKK